jgi:GNAT superfamily N-acetyltransferase
MMQGLDVWRLDALRPGDARAYEAMTFPAYRHLLALRPAPRLPAEPEQRLVQPVGVVARRGDDPLGLALAEAPVRAADGPPELLSVFVATPWRGRGIATSLVEAVESRLREDGFAEVHATYSTGKPSIPAVERVFAKRGWDAPALRTYSVRFTIEEAQATPWYGRVRLPKGAELFSWADLTPEERSRLQESNRRAPWIPNSLQPWRHDVLGFDRVSSVGLRYGGEVVGWMVNHRMDPKTVRFTCSFMRADLSRRARILPLYSEAIRRLAEDGCERGTFVTPTVYPGMVEFIQQHIKPYVSFTGETRGTKKFL